MYRLSSAEELECAKRWADRHLPESLIISQSLKVSLCLVNKPDDSASSTFYVDEWPNPAIIAKVDVQRMYNADDYPRIAFFTNLSNQDAEHEKNVRTFLNRLNKLTRVGEIGGVMLRAIDERWRSLADSIYARDLNLRASVHHWPCAAYWLSEEKRSELRSRGSIQPPAGFEFQSLTPQDAEYVDSQWQHRIAGVTLHWVRRQIQYLPNVCLKETGEFGGRLASFEMTEGVLGIMNHLYTAPDFRRRGLGTLVEQRLAQIMLQKGHTPCKTVLRGNVSGQAITDASSMWQCYGNVFWAMYGDEKMAQEYATGLP